MRRVSSSAARFDKACYEMHEVLTKRCGCDAPLLHDYRRLLLGHNTLILEVRMGNVLALQRVPLEGLSAGHHSTAIGVDVSTMTESCDGTCTCWTNCQYVSCVQDTCTACNSCGPETCVTFPPL